MTDFYVEDAGSVVLITPQTTDAADWLDQMVDAANWQRVGRGLAIDRRCTADLIDGMYEEGFSVRGAA